MINDIIAKLFWLGSSSILIILSNPAYSFSQILWDENCRRLKSRHSPPNEQLQEGQSGDLIASQQRAHSETRLGQLFSHFNYGQACFNHPRGGRPRHLFHPDKEPACAPAKTLCAPPPVDKTSLRELYQKCTTRHAWLFILKHSLTPSNGIRETNVKVDTRVKVINLYLSF